MAFKSGEKWSGNSKGRPVKPEVELFRKALRCAEKREKKSLIQHAVDLSYNDNDVLKVLMNKMLPDISKIDFKDATDYKEILKQDLENRLKLLKK